MNSLKNILFVLTFFIIVNLVTVNAEDLTKLESYKVNSCVNIKVLANCSYINLTEITNSKNTYVINKQMGYIGGQTYNFTFCNTSQIDTYTYSWYNPCIDCSNNLCRKTFEITSYGTSKVTSYYWLMIVIVSLILLLGFYLKNNGIIIIGAIGLLFLGFWIIIYGIDNIKDPRFTWPIGLLIWGLSIYLLIKSAMEELEQK